MISAIGVLLLLAGVTTFIMGAVRYFFPSVNQFVPENFKLFLSVRTGVYLFLGGIVLLKFLA